MKTATRPKRPKRQKSSRPAPREPWSDHPGVGPAQDDAGPNFQQLYYLAAHQRDSALRALNMLANREVLFRAAKDAMDVAEQLLAKLEKVNAALTAADLGERVEP